MRMLPIRYSYDPARRLHLWLNDNCSLEDTGSLGESLAQILAETPSAQPSASGRGVFRFAELPSGIEVALRGFCRGGLVRRVSRRTFLRLLLNIEKLRPVRELKALSYLHRAGVGVPLPLGAVIEMRFGGLVYRGAIGTERIRGTENLQILAPTISVEVLEQVTRQTGAQARLMLDCGVFHSDLHPGNVLVDTAGRVLLIDFDKAVFEDRILTSADPHGFEKPSCSVLVGQRAALAQRWARAVKKRALPARMVHWFQAGLEGLE